MTRFEEQLKSAMARREPPGDFTGRVLAAVARQQTPVAKETFRQRFGRVWVWRLAPAVAASLALVGGVMYEQHQRTVHGEEAKEKLLVAMQIAGSKLRRTQQHVIQIEGPEVN